MSNNRRIVTFVLMCFLFFSILGIAFSENNPNASINASFSPAEAKIGDNVTLTVTIINNGPYDFSNVLIMAKLPQGLTYQSHFTGLERNNYDPNTGIWDVGSMNFGKKGAQKTLNITAKVSSAVSEPAKVQFNQIYYNNNGQVIKADVLPSTTANLKVTDANQQNNSQQNNNQQTNGQQNNMGWIYLIIGAIIVIAIIVAAIYFMRSRV